VKTLDEQIREKEIELARLKGKHPNATMFEIARANATYEPKELAIPGVRDRAYEFIARCAVMREKIDPQKLMEYAMSGADRSKYST